MKLPDKYTITVEQNPSIKNANRRAREWCGSIVGAMVWLSSILPSASYVFRGHANTSWDLQSSLYRTAKPSTLKDLVKSESELLHRVSDDFWFRREFGFVPSTKATARGYDRTVAVLQHHRVPTRLLDVTSDPLVALYFAVIGRSTADDMDDVDACVIFIRNVSKDDGLPIHIVPAPQVSERVTTQRSLFVAPNPGAKTGRASADTVKFDFFNVEVGNGSLTNFDNLIDNFLTGQFSGRPPGRAPNLLCFIVPKDLKKACRSVLRSLGICARNLFPGSDGFRADFAGF